MCLHTPLVCILCLPTPLVKRYRALLLGGAAPAGRVGGKSWGAADGSSEDGVSSDDDDDEQQQKQQSGQARASKQGSNKRAVNKDKESLEMTVTFTPGLDKLGAQLLQKKKEQEERKGDSVWEAYLRCVYPLSVLGEGELGSAD